MLTATATQAESPNTLENDPQQDAPLVHTFSDHDLAPALEKARLNLENLQKDMDSLRERLDRLEENQEQIKKLQLDLDAQVESESNEAHPSALAHFRLTWQDYFANYDHGPLDQGFFRNSATRFWHRQSLGTPNRAQKRTYVLQSCIEQVN